MKSILILVLAIATLAHADQVLQYEPAVMEISGKITKGKEKHPNGSWFDFQLIKLEASASIKADPGNELSVAEKNIREIQLSVTEPAIQKKINARMGKNAVIKGTIFHAHTAWHVRDLVIIVTEVK